MGKIPDLIGPVVLQLPDHLCEIPDINSCPGVAQQQALGEDRGLREGAGFQGGIDRKGPFKDHDFVVRGSYGRRNGSSVGEAGACSKKREECLGEQHSEGHLSSCLVEKIKLD